MTDILLMLFLFSLPVAAVSYTVTRSSIFRGFRNFVDRKNQKLGELVSCPYCFSHWVSAATILYILLYYQVVRLSDYFVADFVFMTFALVAMSSGVCGLIALSIKAQR